MEVLILWITKKNCWHMRTVYTYTSVRNQPDEACAGNYDLAEIINIEAPVAKDMVVQTTDSMVVNPSLLHDLMYTSERDYDGSTNYHCHTAVGLGLGTVLSTVIGRIVATPQNAVVEYADHLRKATSQWKCPMIMARGDEIGDLAKAFDNIGRNPEPLEAGIGQFRGYECRQRRAFSHLRRK